MRTISESDLQAIVAGDSFWRDLSQFIGGAISGGRVLHNAGIPGHAALMGGVIAAAIN